ncbi:MAG: hypothetical protein K6D59_08580 [Bacteroidales bacterium]|nr:hypothetical protein [Bacteroidales bacterium]
MKKNVLFAFIVFCAVSSVSAQDIVNLRMDREQMGLRGNVASMDEDILLRKDYFREDWPERKWFVNDLRSVLREDNGRIVTFNPAGRMVTVTYTYQGKAGKKVACTYAPNGLLSSYTGLGYKVEAKYSGSYADINVYAESQDYGANVDLAKDNLKGLPYSVNYSFDLKCRQELGDNGLVLRSMYYYVDSVLARDCEYNYNHIDQLVSEKSVDYSSGEKTVGSVKYTYDNHGFLVKKVVHSRAIDATYSYENNEMGDCVKMTVERPYGTIVYTYRYEYDEQGNWTVRLEFEDGVFDNAVLRSFTYHKESAKPAKKENVKEEKPAKEKAKKEKKVKEEKPAKENMTKEEKRAEKERIAAEKKAAKEQAKEDKRVKEEKPAKEKAKKEKKVKEEKPAKDNASSVDKKAEKERIAAEKKAAKERAAAEKKAEKERIAAEKRAAKENAAAEKQAEKERKAAEKEAKKASKNK